MNKIKVYGYFSQAERDTDFEQDNGRNLER
jgi:hypothetical protein